MLHIHISELSTADRERLKSELIYVMLSDIAYPLLTETNTTKLRIRPPVRDDRKHARDFVESARLEDLTTIVITSSAFRDRLNDLLFRYYEVVVSRRPEIARMMEPIRKLIPQHVIDIQKRLIAYVLDGVENGFGMREVKRSWRENNGTVPFAPTWEAIMPGTLSLAVALATLREEALPEVSESNSWVTAIISERISTPLAPPVKVDPIPEQKPVPQTHPTVPLPDPIVLPAVSSNMPFNDRPLFIQLREQLMSAMRTAGKNYGLPEVPTDPAGLLNLLRQRNIIDDMDLRLAEGILALCARVITADRASIDDYRQALTFYLLFNRRKLGMP
jgi:hypothetical protein